MPRRAGQIEVVEHEENGVAENAHGSFRVTELERRVVLTHAHVADRDQLPGAVRICEPHVRRSQLTVRPPARLLDSLARAPPFVILVLERDLDRAVAARAFQRVRRRPEVRERERHVVEHRAVHHDVVAVRSAAGQARRLLSVGKDVAEAPLMIGAPAQIHVRAVDLEVRKQQPLIEHVAWIVANDDRPRRHDERILLVADRDRVDLDAGEQTSGDATDVHRAAIAHRARYLRIDERAESRAAEIRLRRRENRPDDAHADEQQDPGADERDEAAA